LREFSRAESFYESGKRSGAWLKYRVNKGQDNIAPRKDVPVIVRHGDRNAASSPRTWRLRKHNGKRFEKLG
jgi:hypothetical protein